MANIDIDVDELIYALDRYEKQQLVDELYDDGYCPKQLKGTLADDEDSDDWDEQIKKLRGNKWRLSKEDEETILKITNKII